MSTIDVLMITFNAPEYVRLSLTRVLESCDENTRVWLWHNGTDEEMLETAKEFAKDARVYKFHHSVENVRLTEPTNWLWAEGDGDFVSKVDDDCLLPVDWIQRLRHAYEYDDKQNFGAIGSSRWRDEDLMPERIPERLIDYGPDMQLYRIHWVQGSGYIMPRRWVDRAGLLQAGQSWTNYCIQLALDGALNGYVYPFIFEDHMDDPRSENTLLHTDADLAWRAPLSIARSKILTLDDWEQRMRRSAREGQVSKLDLRHYQGWRRKAHNLKNKIEKKRRP